MSLTIRSAAIGPDGTKASALTHSLWTGLMTYSMRNAWQTWRRHCGNFYDCTALGYEFAEIHEDEFDNERQRRAAAMDPQNDLQGYNHAFANLYYYNPRDGQTHMHRDAFLCSALQRGARRAARAPLSGRRRPRRQPAGVHLRPEQPRNGAQAATERPEL